MVQLASHGMEDLQETIFVVRGKNMNNFWKFSIIISFILIIIAGILSNAHNNSARAETILLTRPNVFKFKFEGHEYISTGGAYFIHSFSCPCLIKGAKESENDER